MCYRWLLSLSLILITTNLQADKKVEGAFLVQKNCPAFQSFHKKTNPGDLKLSKHVNYQVIAVNRENNPNWVSVVVDTAVPKQRWVNIKCGELHLVDVRDDVCRTPGHATYYRLALNWKPAFCKQHHSRQECQTMETQYGQHPSQGPGFTLHGFWPNLPEKCGIRYGYCGVAKRSAHGDYPVLELSPATLSALTQVMPSIKLGSFLHRHEWFKHGTCQMKWDKNTYFQTAIGLTHEFNGVAKTFLDKHLGGDVNKKDFLDLLSSHFGEKIKKNITLKCSGHMLTEIYLNLPLDVRHGEGLKSLIARSDREGKDGCAQHAVFKLAKWGVSSHPSEEKKQ